MSTHTTALPNTGGADRATIGAAFSPRHNSLNFLRLVLAVAVVFSHSITLGTYGSEVILGKTTLGTIAVYGFFGLSGFLIAGSASHNGVGRYLWQRFLRIFPGFWICLVVTAFVFGSIAWWHQNPVRARACGLHCYVTQPAGPIGYVIHNFLLVGNQPTISGTLPPGIFRNVWNGSLWTLFFEFLCYLMLAALSVAGLLRHRAVVAVLALGTYVASIVVTSVPNLAADFSPSHHWYVMQMFTFVPLFLTGSLVFLYRERIPDSGLVAIVSTGLFLLGFVLPLGAGVPVFTFTSMGLTSVFLVYPLLWLGIHLPFSRVGARNDYSYGIYVYAFPIQQLLVLWGVSRWGYWPYTLVTLLVLGPVAAASWWAVEKHALKLKTIRLPRSEPPSVRLGTEDT